MDSNAYVSLRVEAWQNGTPRGVSPAHNFARHTGGHIFKFQREEGRPEAAISS